MECATSTLISCPIKNNKKQKNNNNFKLKWSDIIYMINYKNIFNIFYYQLARDAIDRGTFATLTRVVACVRAWPSASSATDVDQDLTIWYQEWDASRALAQPAPWERNAIRAGSVLAGKDLTARGARDAQRASTAIRGAELAVAASLGHFTAKLKLCAIATKREGALARYINWKITI